MQFQADTNGIGQGLKSGNIPSLLTFRWNNYDEECIFRKKTHRQQKYKITWHFVGTNPHPPDQTMIAGIFSPNQLSLPILN